MPKGIPKGLDRRGIEALHEILHYDPETGVWTWQVRRTWKIRAGDIAGSLNRDGCRQIVINNQPYVASRLAWFYMTGEWPPHEIDHRNRDQRDNRWDNLRLATHQQNCWNRGIRKDNQIHLKGVTTEGDKYVAYIGKGVGKTKYLGAFNTPEEAHLTYKTAAIRKYGEFYCAG